MVVDFRMGLNGEVRVMCSLVGEWSGEVGGRNFRVGGGVGVRWGVDGVLLWFL